MDFINGEQGDKVLMSLSQNPTNQAAMLGHLGAALAQLHGVKHTWHNSYNERLFRPQHHTRTHISMHSPIGGMAGLG